MLLLAGEAEEFQNQITLSLLNDTTLLEFGNLDFKSFQNWRKNEQFYFDTNHVHYLQRTFLRWFG